MDRESHPSSGREELSFIKNVQEYVHYGKILILKPPPKKKISTWREGRVLGWKNGTGSIIEIQKHKVCLRDRWSDQCGACMVTGEKFIYKGMEVLIPNEKLWKVADSGQ